MAGQQQKTTAAEVAPMARLQAALPAQAARFRSAAPFPHVRVDGLLHPDVARAAAAAFPRPHGPEWIHYKHVNERKQGNPRRDTYPEPLARVVDGLSTPEFVAWLEALTGLRGLQPDPMLEGAGLHQSGPGGFLNVHTDFQRHHHRREWRRTVNLILFLNPDWDESWGGHIELWGPDMAAVGARYPPLLNQAVIFHSTGTSLHGHPEPLRCPEGVTRDSLALYYYTEVEGDLEHEYSWFRPRPGDGRARRLAMKLDNGLVRAWSWMKRRRQLDDGRVSRALGALDRLRRR